MTSTVGRVMSHRRVTAQVRAGKRRGEFTAIAVTYESTPDSYGTIWARGCFTASLDGHLPVVHLGHSWLHPIGRATSWRDTAVGPELTCRLDAVPEVPVGQQVAAQIESGTLTDVSVGFATLRQRNPTDAELDRWPGATEIVEEADLLELSVVSLGAVPGAVITGARSAGPSRERQRLARELAAGRITPAQYRSWLEIERKADEALEIVRLAELRRRDEYAERPQPRPATSRLFDPSRRRFLTADEARDWLRSR